MSIRETTAATTGHLPSQTGGTERWTSWSRAALSGSATAWLAATLTGQAIFAAYVAIFYGGAAIAGNYERWGKVLPRGFDAADPLGNALLGLHLLLAVAWVTGGVLQLIPDIRRSSPAFHRWNGRMYIGFAAMLASGGLWLASELDLRQAQSLAASARAALAQFTRQRELDLNALTLLVGQPLAVTPLPRIQSLVFAEVPTGLPSEVLLQRPDVRQAEQLLVAANANIGAARAAYWPRISLTASLGTASTQLGDLFKDGAWSFAAQLLMPIFDAGRTESLVRGATAQRDIALAQYERAIQAAFRDVADALAGRATLVDQLRALEVQRQAEAARLQLVQVRVDNGVGTTLELLDAERSLFAAAQAEVQTRLAEQQSRIAMYRALGGGVQ